MLKLIMNRNSMDFNIHIGKITYRKDTGKFDQYGGYNVYTLSLYWLLEIVYLKKLKF